MKKEDTKKTVKENGEKKVNREITPSEMEQVTGGSSKPHRTYKPVR